MLTNSHRIKINGILVSISKKPSKLIKISKLNTRSPEDVMIIIKYLIEEGFITPVGPIVQFDLANCKF